MVYRGSRPRESRFLHARRDSTADTKHKRHRNKKRIWRRAVRKLEAAVIMFANVETAPSGAVSLDVIKVTGIGSNV